MPPVPEPAPAGAQRGAVALRDLVAHLDALLAAGEGGDYGPNGLQVEGRPTVRRVVTGVSACGALFAAAAERRADAVLVHHGLYWDGQAVLPVGVLGRRLRQLFAAEMSLLAYHLPLDRHPELGNNALAARAYGLLDRRPFAAVKGLPVGFHGHLPEPLPVAELVRRTAEIFGQPPLHLPGGPDPVRTLGLVSGGAQSAVHEAIALGLDAFLTGEVSEWVTHTVREAGIHYLAAGHHATERLGIRALGEHLARDLGLEVEFVDVPNPV